MGGGGCARLKTDAFLKQSTVYIGYIEENLQQGIENIRKSILK